MSTEEAAAARNREWDDDTVASLEIGDATADVLDNAHELVAENIAAAHRRDETVIEMQIGAANRGRGDPHDRIARGDEGRIGDVFDARLRCVRVARPDGCPSVVGISPASISCLNRRRSSRIVWFGSSPNIFATAAPNLPPGG